MVALTAGNPRISSVALARIEVASVFHRKLREGAINASIHRELCLQFSADIAAGVWAFMPITDSLSLSAQSAYQNLPSTVYLRFADCLHLCAAAEAGFKEIYSNDRHLLAAASHFKLKGIDVTNGV